mgnify:CR=1 FL=1
MTDLMKLQYVAALAWIVVATLVGLMEGHNWAAIIAGAYIIRTGLRNDG